MTGIVEHQLTLRHDPMMLTSGLHRHQKVVFTVQKEHRHLQRLEDPPQRSLIAVVEIAGVGDAEEGIIEPTKVGDTFQQEPQTAELKPMDSAIEVIVA